MTKMSFFSNIYRPTVQLTNQYYMMQNRIKLMKYLVVIVLVYISLFIIHFTVYFG